LANFDEREPTRRASAKCDPSFFCHTRLLEYEDMGAGSDDRSFGLVGAFGHDFSLGQCLGFGQRFAIRRDHEMTNAQIIQNAVIDFADSVYGPFIS